MPVLTLQVGVAEHFPLASPVPHALVAKFFNTGGIPQSPSREWVKGLPGRLKVFGKCLTTIWSIKPGLYRFIS